VLEKLAREMQKRLIPSKKGQVLALILFQLIFTYLLYTRSSVGPDQTPQTPFSKVYLINRKSRVDRLITMMDIMNLIQVDYQVVDAIDIDSYETDQAAKTNNLRVGETACYASHAAVLRQAMIDDYSSIMVLEDDIDMDIAFSSQLFEVIDGLQGKNIPWDLIFFGHCLEARGTFVQKTANFEVLQSVHPSCTHAYAITKQGIRKLFQAYEEDINDLKKLQLPIDYMFQKAMREKVLIGYSVFPQIVIQHRTGNGIKSDLRPDEELDQPTLRQSVLALVSKENQ
jgi:GR25 family glycosyltransferase involved in LPS biosynthesis